MPMKTKQAQRKYQREWKAQRRAKWFAGKSCDTCGSTANLELDHIDPGQKLDHKIWSWSETRRQAELARCRPLCRSCHQTRSADQQRQPLKHGKNWTYTKRKCRCLLCREAHRIHNRRFK